jgi:quercetin dioxygenase-like cupin family protein
MSGFYGGSYYIRGLYKSNNEEQAMKITKYKDIPGQPVEGKPWVTIHKVISEADGAPNFTMRVFEQRPGEVESHLESHWQEHEVYVLSGRGVVRTPKGSAPLRAGDVVYIAPWEEHQVANAGETPFRFVCLIPNDTKEPKQG